MALESCFVLGCKFSHFFCYSIFIGDLVDQLIWQIIGCFCDLRKILMLVRLELPQREMLYVHIDFKTTLKISRVNLIVLFLNSG